MSKRRGWAAGVLGVISRRRVAGVTFLAVVVMFATQVVGLTLGGISSPVSAAAGPSWTAVTAPLNGLNPSADVSSAAKLAHVSCPAPGSCVAVGSYSDASRSVSDGLIEVLSVGVWTPKNPPTSGLNPPDASSSVNLADVSCSAPGSCVAVGDYSSGNGDDRGVIETLSGGSWKAITLGLPTPGTDVVVLNSVSCFAPGSCVAVGYYQDPANRNGLIETLSGGTWTATTASVSTLNPVPIDNPVNVFLNSVSCRAANACIAVGYYEDSAGNYDGLIETLSSAAWIASNPPVTGLNPIPASTSTTILNGVSCSVLGTCVAVGTYYSNGTWGLLETLSGGTWTATTVPVSALDPPAQTGNVSGGGAPDIVLFGVSCSATQSCVAVGEYSDSNFQDWGLIETFSGGTWTATTAPLGGLNPAPTVPSSSFLLGVSCVPTGECIAVGYYSGGGLIEEANAGSAGGTGPVMTTLIPAAPSPTDALLSRGLDIAAITGSDGKRVVKYEYGWATSPTATQPDPGVYQTCKAGKACRLNFATTNPNQDWTLLGRAVDAGRRASTWKSTVVPTPKAPILVALGDSITSGHHRDSSVSATICNDPAYGYPADVFAKMESSLPSQWQRPLGYYNDAYSGFGLYKVLHGGPDACHVSAPPSIESADTELRQNVTSPTVGSWDQVVISAGVDDTNWGAVVTAIAEHYADGINTVYGLRRKYCRQDINLANGHGWNGSAISTQETIESEVRELVSSNQVADPSSLRIADPSAALWWVGYYNIANTGIGLPGPSRPIVPSSCAGPIQKAMELLTSTIQTGLRGVPYTWINSDKVLHMNSRVLQSFYVTDIVGGPSGWPHPNRTGASAIASLFKKGL